MGMCAFVCCVCCVNVNVCVIRFACVFFVSFRSPFFLIVFPAPPFFLARFIFLFSYCTHLYTFS